ncbi:MAG: hypothetical protein ABI389_00455 [Rhodanobacter sp.]
MQRHQFEITVELDIWHAGNMAIPELLGVGERLTAPDFFGDISKPDRVNIGCLDDATKSPFRIEDLDDVPWLIATLA